MKLMRFALGDAQPNLGVVIGDHAVSFAVLQLRSGILSPELGDSRAYLTGLPETEQAARRLLAWGETHLGELSTGEKPQLAAVRLHAPVEVAAMFDFGLTPRHLKNSAETMMKYEKDNPQTAPLLQAFAKSVLTPKPKPGPGRPGPLPYYKCNLNTIVGDGVVVPRPAYTSRLDIEPELLVVSGNAQQPVAGYSIFNDVPARDVQAPEFVGGFCLTKDMAKGNQIGPYLVTPDELADPYQREVTVTVNGQPKFKGSTAEISHRAEAVFAWLQCIAPLTPGSAMGLGTMPDSTGLDHDDFIDPGAEIEIGFERLGSLHSRFAEPLRRAGEQVAAQPVAGTAAVSEISPLTAQTAGNPRQ